MYRITVNYHWELRDPSFDSYDGHGRFNKTSKSRESGKTNYTPEKSIYEKNKFKKLYKYLETVLMKFLYKKLSSLLVGNSTD